MKTPKFEQDVVDYIGKVMSGVKIAPHEYEHAQSYRARVAGFHLWFKDQDRKPNECVGCNEYNQGHHDGCVVEFLVQGWQLAQDLFDFAWKLHDMLIGELPVFDLKYLLSEERQVFKVVTSLYQDSVAEMIKEVNNG